MSGPVGLCTQAMNFDAAPALCLAAMLLLLVRGVLRGGGAQQRRCRSAGVVGVRVGGGWGRRAGWCSRRPVHHAARRGRRERVGRRQGEGAVKSTDASWLDVVFVAHNPLPRPSPAPWYCAHHAQGGGGAPMQIGLGRGGAAAVPLFEPLHRPAGRGQHHKHSRRGWRGALWVWAALLVAVATGARARGAAGGPRCLCGCDTLTHAPSQAGGGWPAGTRRACTRCTARGGSNGWWARRAAPSLRAAWIRYWRRSWRGD